MTALISQHLHRRNVRVSVTEKDHALEWNRPSIFGHVLIDSFIVPVILHVFVDTKQILRLSGVIDGYAWPRCDFSVVDEFRSIDFVKCVLDRSAANHPSMSEDTI
jgi:hypothetical protein